MTRQNAERFAEFLSFLKKFKAVSLFTWEIEESETYCNGCGLLIHVLDPLYVHEVLDLISGISGVTFFSWHVYSSKDYALDIFLY